MWGRVDVCSVVVVVENGLFAVSGGWWKCGKVV